MDGGVHQDVFLPLTSEFGMSIEPFCVIVVCCSEGCELPVIYLQTRNVCHPLDVRLESNISLAKGH